MQLSHSPMTSRPKPRPPLSPVDLSGSSDDEWVDDTDDWAPQPVALALSGASAQSLPVTASREASAPLHARVKSSPVPASRSAAKRESTSDAVQCAASKDTLVLPQPSSSKPPAAPPRTAQSMAAAESVRVTRTVTVTSAAPSPVNSSITPVSRSESSPSPSMVDSAPYEKRITVRALQRQFHQPPTTQSPQRPVASMPGSVWAIVADIALQRVVHDATARSPAPVTVTESEPAPTVSALPLCPSASPSASASSVSVPALSYHDSATVVRLLQKIRTPHSLITCRAHASMLEPFKHALSECLSLSAFAAAFPGTLASDLARRMRKLIDVEQSCEHAQHALIRALLELCHSYQRQQLVAPLEDALTITLALLHRHAIQQYLDCEEDGENVRVNRTTPAASSYLACSRSRLSADEYEYESNPQAALMDLTARRAELRRQAEDETRQDREAQEHCSTIIDYLEQLTACVSLRRNEWQAREWQLLDRPSQSPTSIVHWLDLLSPQRRVRHELRVAASQLLEALLPSCELSGSESETYHTRSDTATAETVAREDHSTTANADSVNVSDHDNLSPPLDLDALDAAVRAHEVSKRHRAWQRLAAHYRQRNLLRSLEAIHTQLLANIQCYYERPRDSGVLQFHNPTREVHQSISNEQRKSRERAKQSAKLALSGHYRLDDERHVDHRAALQKSFVDDWCVPLSARLSHLLVALQSSTVTPSTIVARFDVQCGPGRRAIVQHDDRGYRYLSARFYATFFDPNIFYSASLMEQFSTDALYRTPILQLVIAALVGGDTEGDSVVSPLVRVLHTFFNHPYHRALRPTTSQFDDWLQDTSTISDCRSAIMEGFMQRLILLGGCDDSDPALTVLTPPFLASLYEHALASVDTMDRFYVCLSSLFCHGPRQCLRTAVTGEPPASASDRDRATRWFTLVDTILSFYIEQCIAHGGAVEPDRMHAHSLVSFFWLVHSWQSMNRSLLVLALKDTDCCVRVRAIEATCRTLDISALQPRVSISASHAMPLQHASIAIQAYSQYRYYCQDRQALQQAAAVAGSVAITVVTVKCEDDAAMSVKTESETKLTSMKRERGAASGRGEVDERLSDDKRIKTETGRSDR